MTPTIVVAGYDRSASLERLLSSLKACHFPQGEVRLVISIDGGGAPSVARLAKAYEWPYGEKRVILHDSKQGLREHIFSCGDLTTDYGPIIMLEDDLGVSQWFYQFAINALERFGKDERIAGISLYRYAVNVNCGFRFDPIDFGLGCFLMQVPQSWGQVWTQAQWKKFRAWYDVPQNRTKPLDIPNNVEAWPESSWLKYFTRYVVDTGRYFLYPTSSVSTNFSEPGTHMTQGSNAYHVPLATGPVSFSDAASFENCAKYDVYFEIEDSTLKRLVPDLEGSMVIDLYGYRDLSVISEENWVLTVRKHRNAVRHYGMRLRPRELNVVQSVPGEVIGLVRKKDLDEADAGGLRREFDYDMRWFGKLRMLKVLKESLFGA